MRTARLLMVVSLLIPAFAPPSYAKVIPRVWCSGSVLSARLSGHGSGNESSRRANKRDVWWTYCVSGENQTYSAVSRVNPSKAGFAVGSPVKFSVDKDRLYMLNAKGDRYILRRLSLDNEKGCR